MAEESSYLGEGSRLTERPSPALAALGFGHELEGAEYLWSGLAHADLAHAVALIEAGIVREPDATALLQGLLALEEQHPTPPVLDPSIGDVYNNREQLLREIAGTVTAWMPTGRARREATTIAWQIACRRGLAALGNSVAELSLAMAELAEDHRLSVMPDYTYLQHAHPTSLGHFLLSHAGPIARHQARIEHAFASVNQSPAGSGSVNGTTIPLDRRRLAELLDFDGLIANTRDAMWAPDLVVDQLAVITAVLVSIDRLAEELQLWCTEEFGFVTLADRHCRTSVIMPQKKNPYALSYLRGTARFLIPTATSIISTMLTPTGQPENRTYAYLWLPRALADTKNATDLLTEVLVEATFDRAALARATTEGFLETTEICDLLTLRHNIPNRLAHRIVGRTVKDAIDTGRSRLEPADLSAAAAGIGVDFPELSLRDLDALADPVAVLASRRTIGGAGPEAMDAMIDDHRSSARTALAVWDRPSLNDASTAHRAAREILAGHALD